MEKLILSNVSLEDLANVLAEKVREIQLNTYQPEPVAKDEFLNIRQAAELLNLAVATIYTLTCRKKIPYFKKGKKVYFKRFELEAWLDSGKKHPVDTQNTSTSELFIRNKRK
ncbi:MAG: helix-turn-helix domain-containing protein [Bacteroidota bacterium]